VEETNWTTASLTATNPWEGLYAENNPCPLGWRVPSGNEWDNERNSWNSITHNYTNPGGSQVSMTTRDPNSGFSNLKLRMSTIRSGSPNSTYWPNTNYQGRLQSKITTGYTLYPQSLYWTSRLVDGSNASVLQVTTGAYDVSSYDYSNYTQSAVGNGAFVRCIRSDGYNTNTQAFD
jgi:uncharacterized protein (TIGR02145 family)